MTLLTSQEAKRRTPRQGMNFHTVLTTALMALWNPSQFGSQGYPSANIGIMKTFCLSSVYIYIYVCVCVCLRAGALQRALVVSTTGCRFPPIKQTAKNDVLNEQTWNPRSTAGPLAQPPASSWRPQHIPPCGGGA